MGAPHIQPKIYDFLKASPGEVFTSTQIRERLGVGGEGQGSGKSVCTSLRGLAKKHPATIKIVPFGSRLFGVKYVPSNGTAASAAARQEASKVPQQQSENDVLITIPMPNNKSETLTVSQARKIYDQLNIVFGRASK